MARRGRGSSEGRCREGLGGRIGDGRTFYRRWRLPERQYDGRVSGRSLIGFTEKMFVFHVSLERGRVLED